MKHLLLPLIFSVLFFSSCQNTVKNSGSNTIVNLKDGIKGETTAGQKYAAYAHKARTEGYDTIAKLFDAASKSEFIHILNHTRELEELDLKMDYFVPEYVVKTTLENLQDAIDGESYEVNTMYPAFIIDAGNEKMDSAQKSFTWAFETEKIHVQLFTAALKAFNEKNMSALSFEYAVCPLCGNTFEKHNSPDICPICLSPRLIFIII